MTGFRVHRDLRPLVEAAEAAGWTVTQTRNSHLRLVPPTKDGTPLILSGSPSDHRSILNARAALRRQGVSV